MGAAQHQHIHFPGLCAKRAHGFSVFFAQRRHCVVVGVLPLLLDRIGQTFTRLQYKRNICWQTTQQALKLLALQGARCRHHAHALRVAHGRCRFDGGFHAEHRQFWVSAAHVLNGHGGGGVASHHQRFHLVLLAHEVQQMISALLHKVGIALAIRRMAAVGHIHKLFVRHLRLQRFQNAQAAHAAVKHADGRGLVQLHWALTSMPLNSPVAMRLDHSAGPVMWALVPPASTATVTGMSTTSNS